MFAKTAGLNVVAVPYSGVAPAIHDTLAGRTQLAYESLGDTAAFGNVREVIGQLKDTTTACEGRVVKTVGDGLMWQTSSDRTVIPGRTAAPVSVPGGAKRNDQINRRGVENFRFLLWVLSAPLRFIIA